MTDADIKKQVGSQIHKQFGHTRKFTERDKKGMEKWICELFHQELNKIQQVQLQKTPSTLTPRQITSGNDKYAKQIDEIRRGLLNIQNILIEHLPDDFNREMVLEKTKSHNPVQVLISQLNRDVCALVDHKQHMEDEIYHCFKILDEKAEDSLQCTVQKMVERLQEKELTLVNERYSHEILAEKMDDLKKVEHKFNIQNMEMSTLRNEKYQLLEKCRMLEHNIQQLREMSNGVRNSSNYEDQSRSRQQHTRGAGNFTSNQKKYRENRNPIDMNDSVVGRKLRRRIRSDN